MNIFGQFLDDRDGRRGSDTQDRAKAADAWRLRDQAPEDRLIKFDAWVRHELATRLVWTWAGEQRERRIEQCRIYLERLVLEMWRRGWMLDGKQLAEHIEGVLDSIGKYQRAGKVADFWPYFKTSVDRYVGANAEEIQAQAVRIGAHIGQLLGPLGIKVDAPAAALPELLAQRAGEVSQAKEETLREKQRRARAREAARKGDAQQQTLL